jgi:hypothetical protein
MEDMSAKIPPATALVRAPPAAHRPFGNVAPTEAMPVIDERTVPRVLDLATRIGESMFAVGASAHEVTLAITRVCGAYGMKDVQVDVTYNSITVSFHLSGEVWPETLVRVVRVAAPDHAKLQRVQALVSDIDDGLDLESARRLSVPSGAYRSVTSSRSSSSPAHCSRSASASCSVPLRSSSGSRSSRLCAPHSPRPVSPGSGFHCSSVRSPEVS